MQVRRYIGFANPTNFYFIEFPVETKLSMPGSSIYTFVELGVFLTRIVEKYPGNLRDLSSDIDTHPHYIMEFMRTTSPQNKPRPAFDSLVSFETVRRLVKLYYSLVIAKNPNTTSY